MGQTWVEYIAELESEQRAATSILSDRNLLAMRIKYSRPNTRPKSRKPRKRRYVYVKKDSEFVQKDQNDDSSTNASDRRLAEEHIDTPMFFGGLLSLLFVCIIVYLYKRRETISKRTEMPAGRQRAPSKKTWMGY